MNTLIRYELKKLLSRRILWAALVLGMAIFVYIQLPMIQEALSGHVQGMRDVYVRYEGREATEDLREQARQELEAYIAAHPDDFIEGPTTIPMLGGYSSGVYEAYGRIIQIQTRQEQQQQASTYQAILETGHMQDGTPLNGWDRTFFLYCIRKAQQQPVIVYQKGYEYMTYPQATGPLALGILVLALSALFAGEKTARMEPVALCAAGRRRAARAKIAAALLTAAGLFVLFYGSSILLVTLSYGLDGGEAAATGLYAREGETLAQNLTAYLALSLTALLASAALTAWVSTVFAHPMTALLGGAAAAAVQYLPHTAMTAIPYTGGLLAGFTRMTAFLPTPMLTAGNSLFNTGGALGMLAAGIGSSALIFTLSIYQTPRCWLRQRKV